MWTDVILPDKIVTVLFNEYQMFYPPPPSCVTSPTQPLLIHKLRHFNSEFKLRRKIQKFFHLKYMFKDVFLQLEIKEKLESLLRMTIIESQLMFECWKI